MFSLKKYSYLISINILILLTGLILIELIFGYWFKEENFGIYMRKERKINWQSQSIFNGKKYEFYYKRNFWGFRGDELSPENVKIIFEGGSTGNQRYTPEENTIVGVLNDKFKTLDYDFKIYNASTDGKSVNGYINDFKFWFPKINNFYPDYVIFYVGINDRLIHNKYLDFKISEKKIDQIKDYIKNNSFFIDKLKLLKNKYFPKRTLAYNFDNKSLYNDFKFIDYKTATTIHKNLNDSDKILIKSFNLRLNELKKIIDSQNFQPIFITQLKFDGLKDKHLFLINNELKNFAEINNYFIIPLDEILSFNRKDFYDEIHTTPIGSKKIANKIFPELIKILSKNK